MVYENVVRVAREKKISLTDLEKAAGLGNGTIGKWAKADPQLSNVLKVAKVLDVTLEDLVAEVPNGTP